MVYNALIVGQFFKCYKCIYFGAEEIRYSANGDHWQVGRRRSFDCLNKKRRGSTGSFLDDRTDRALLVQSYVQKLPAARWNIDEKRSKKEKKKGTPRLCSLQLSWTAASCSPNLKRSCHGRTKCEERGWWMANASTRIESRAGQRARLVLQAGHSQVALPPGAHVHTHAWKESKSLPFPVPNCRCMQAGGKKRGGYASVIPDCTVCAGVDQTAAGAFLWKKKNKKSCR
jgi:hypothetical protein